MRQLKNAEESNAAIAQLNSILGVVLQERQQSKVRLENQTSSGLNPRKIEQSASASIHEQNKTKDISSCLKVQKTYSHSINDRLCSLRADYVNACNVFVQIDFRTSSGEMINWHQVKSNTSGSLSLMSKSSCGQLPSQVKWEARAL